MLLLSAACSGDATAPPANRAPEVVGGATGAKSGGVRADKGGGRVGLLRGPARRFAGLRGFELEHGGCPGGPVGDLLWHPRIRAPRRLLLRAGAVGAAAVPVTASDPSGLEAQAVFAAAVTRRPWERAALGALYEATDGPNWTRRDNW